jgi:hypothetical protein
MGQWEIRRIIRIGGLPQLLNAPGHIFMIVCERSSWYLFGNSRRQALHNKPAACSTSRVFMIADERALMASATIINRTRERGHPGRNASMQAS